MEYKKYQHVERLGTEGTQGLLDGEVYVFPKLDGTNASIWREYDEFFSSLHFGSRNRELSVQKDNHGFMNAFVGSADGSFQCALNNLFDELGNVILYGEWLVKHQVQYQDDAYRKFYIFDVFDLDTLEYRHYNDYIEPVVNSCLRCNLLSYIEPIWIFDALEDELGGDEVSEGINMCLHDNKWLVKDGVGEGIVIKRYGYKNPFGHTVWGKVIAQDYATKKVQRLTTPKDSVAIEDKIIDKFFDVSVINKEWTGIKPHCTLGEDLGIEYTWKPSNYPHLIERCWRTFLIEETYEFSKWSKNAKIDFKRLRGQLTIKLKEYVEGGGLG